MSKTDFSFLMAYIFMAPHIDQWAALLLGGLWLVVAMLHMVAE